MATRTQEIKNMRLISHHDLNGFGDLGEGIALHRTSDGRRIFYMAHVGSRWGCLCVRLGQQPGAGFWTLP